MEKIGSRLALVALGFCPPLLMVYGSVALVELQFVCTELDVGVDGPSR
jgi:hypothetical protein